MDTNILNLLIKHIKELRYDYKERETFDKRINLLVKEAFKYEKDKELREEEMTKFRNFIEKLAVWYELRYPSDLIYNMNIEKEGLPRGKEEYQTSSFISSLSAGEKVILEKTSYSPLVYLSEVSRTHVFLDEEGIITNAKCLYYPSPYFLVTKEYVSGEKFEGMSILEAKEIFDRMGLIDETSNIENVISNYEINWLKRETLIECVIYRILERGKNYHSLILACLFTLEFEGNLAIPLKYGMFSNHTEIKLFINKYLENGGSKDLVCLRNYFCNLYRKEKFEKTIIQDIIEYFNKRDCYTKEELELGRELIEILKVKLNDKIKEKETSKQKRIERNLEKSRKRINI